MLPAANSITQRTETSASTNPPACVVVKWMHPIAVASERRGNANGECHWKVKGSAALAGNECAGSGMSAR